MLKKRKQNKNNSENITDYPPAHTIKHTPEPNQPYCPPTPETLYIGLNGIADSKVPPEIQAKIEREHIEETRQIVFSNYRNILSNGLLNDSETKWYEIISHATSEAELKNINETLNAMASGNS